MILHSYFTRETDLIKLKSIICNVIATQPLICDGFLQPVCNDQYKAFLDFLYNPSPSLSVNDKSRILRQFQHSLVLVTAILEVSLHPHPIISDIKHKTENVAINIPI